MRRITDGVKTTQTYKTTDGLEKAFVEEMKHTFLFDDGDAGLVFMNPTTYDQVHLTQATWSAIAVDLSAAGNGGRSHHVRRPGALDRTAAARDRDIDTPSRW